MQRAARGPLESALAPSTWEWPPRASPGMAVGAAMAPPDPAVIGTIRMRTAMGRSLHVAVAAWRGDQAGWWSREGLMARVGGVRTHVARRDRGEADQGLGGFGTGLDRLVVRGRRLAPRGSSPAPRSMPEHAQAAQSKEQACVEK
jgi:hypothetical protein